MTIETITLYRPTGPAELELVRASGFRQWPPRLPEQPILYPVTNRAYAEQIARDWNVKNDGAGYVTMFRVRADFMQRYETKQVGSKDHKEWWIPAQDLPELNDNIVGKIELIASYGDTDGTRLP